MIKLDSDISEKFDEIVLIQNRKSDLTCKSNYYSILAREKMEENRDYKIFYDEYKELYSNYKHFYIFRIDKIIELFKKYLYVNDELCINSMYMGDYIRIALTLFEFLIDNYYGGFYRKNSMITKNDFNKKIASLSSALKSKTQHDCYDEYQDLRESLTLFWNPFDKSFVKDLIKLYFIVKNNTNICNNIKLDIKAIEEFITYKCVEYDVVDGAFDFLAHSPNSLNTWFIRNVYDSNSAKLVYNLLQEKASVINCYNHKLTYYFNNVISIIKDSNDSYLQQKYIQFNGINIEKYDIEDKIKILQNLENDIFKKLKIFGTYSVANQYEEIFFDYNAKQKNGNELYDDINLINIKYDSIKENSFRSYFDKVINSANRLEELIKSTDNEEDFYNYLYKIAEKNNINFDDLSDDEVEEALFFLLNNFFDLERKAESTNLSYQYMTNDCLTENRLRLLYQEMKGFFDDFNFEITRYKYLKNDFVSLNDIPRLIKESETTCCMYELAELSTFYKDITIKEEFDKNVAYQYLLNDFIEINNTNAEIIINKLLYYTKVKKVLLSASYFWNIFEKTNDVTIDKDGRDYTPIVANYFKSIELLLYYKIKEKYKNMIEQEVELLPIYAANGSRINILKEDELTLGEMYKYIKREKRIVKEDLDNDVIAEKIKYWADNVRNSNFHKDLILTKSLAHRLKYDSLTLLDEIIYYFE